jgi:organic hydroperoxide reductase OsmC/OhrA
MHPLPHRYSVAAFGRADGDVALEGGRLPTLSSAPPVEFGGPGDRWSPETLLVAAVADCLILSFRSVARARRLSWTSIRCEASGTLDQVEGITQFTAFHLDVKVSLPASGEADTAARAIEKAERVCLIANSLKATPHLTIAINVDGAQPPATSTAAA